MIQSRPPFRERSKPLSAPRRRWLASVGLIASAIAPLTNCPRFAETHIASLEPERLRGALSAASLALLHEGEAAGVPGADVVALRLAELG